MFNEGDEDWDTDPDYINTGTERDLRWGTSIRAYSYSSTAETLPIVSGTVHGTPQAHYKTLVV